MTQKTAAKKPKKELTAKDISLGDAVKVLSMNLKGTVSSRPDNKGFLFVQMGIIRSKVHISDLELIDEAEITTPVSYTHLLFTLMVILVIPGISHRDFTSCSSFGSLFPFRIRQTITSFVKYP